MNSYSSTIINESPWAHVIELLSYHPSPSHWLKLSCAAKFFLNNFCFVFCFACLFAIRYLWIEAKCTFVPGAGIWRAWAGHLSPHHWRGPVARAWRGALRPRHNWARVYSGCAMWCDVMWWRWWLRSLLAVIQIISEWMKYSWMNSSLHCQIDLLEMYVCLDAPAVYFLLPTDENIEAICRDLHHKLYGCCMHLASCFKMTVTMDG